MGIEVLKNELKKARDVSLGRKKLNTEDILKLINLIENYSISELIDNCLAKNKKEQRRFYLKIFWY